MQIPVVHVDSGVARGKGIGPPRAARPGGDILDKHYVVFFNNFEQPLLCYIAYLLISNHLTVLPNAQAQSRKNGPRAPLFRLHFGVFSRV